MPLIAHALGRLTRAFGLSPEENDNAQRLNHRYAQLQNAGRRSANLPRLFRE